MYDPRGAGLTKEVGLTGEHGVVGEGEGGHVGWQGGHA